MYISIEKYEYSRLLGPDMMVERYIDKILMCAYGKISPIAADHERKLRQSRDTLR